MTNEERDALIAQGWTPPKVVDPDLIEAQQIFSNSSLTTPIGMTLTGIKRGRELERAVMGNPIPEQIQEVKPTVAVDPDIAQAMTLWLDGLSALDLALAGIKRGRALAAEAKPGVVWVKHDGSDECPLTMDDFILIARKGRHPFIEWSGGSTWQEITHYAVITPPEEDK